jgi:hypothetical protein
MVTDSTNLLCKHCLVPSVSVEMESIVRASLKRKLMLVVLKAGGMF